MSQHAFVVLYAGETVGAAQIVGASAEEGLVRLAASKMLQSLEDVAADPVSTAVDAGRREGLRLVVGEPSGTQPDLSFVTAQITEQMAPPER